MCWGSHIPQTSLCVCDLWFFFSQAFLFYLIFCYHEVYYLDKTITRRAIEDRYGDLKTSLKYFGVR